VGLVRCQRRPALAGTIDQRTVFARSPGLTPAVRFADIDRILDKPPSEPGEALPPGLIAPAAESVVRKRFEWTYKLALYSAELAIRCGVYEELRARKRIVDSQRWGREYVAMGITGEVRDLAMQLTRLGQPFRSYDEVSLTLALVQQVVTYELEDGEYPRYPVETLVEQKGIRQKKSWVASGSGSLPSE
jgi:hypothetical protein